MSAALAALALTAPHPRERPLILVQPVRLAPRVDRLALSGALLLLGAVVVGLVDVVRVWGGSGPLGLSMVLLLAALPGLTRWAHRLDRLERRRRSGATCTPSGDRTREST